MSSSAALAGYDAARHGAGLIDRRERGRIIVSGQDRAAYLQGLLTNDIAALKAGQGCYSAYLTAQGRMISDLWVHELGDVILLIMPLTTKDTVLARLDQFIFSEDVQLGDVTATLASIAVAGPQAADVVTAALEGLARDALPAAQVIGNVRARFANEPAIVVSLGDAGAPGFEVLVPVAHYDAIHWSLQSAGGVDVAPEAADVLRIEGGVAAFRRDMNEETIPLEAGLESSAISLTKGCYVGQEVIIRVLHRGHGRVARRLVGLVLDGTAVPAAEATISAAGRDVGRVTSPAWSPALQRPIALGYVHRDFTEPGTTVEVAGTTAVVTALPFAH
jgi:folate-binding protein YgfZ